MRKYKFLRSCVAWPKADVNSPGGLSDMIDSSLDITRRTFLKHICREDLRNLEAALGYALHPSQGMTMSADCYISYRRSKWHGKRVYFFTQSCVEYVFTTHEEN